MLDKSSVSNNLFWYISKSKYVAELLFIKIVFCINIVLTVLVCSAIIVSLVSIHILIEWFDKLYSLIAPMQNFSLLLIRINREHIPIPFVLHCTLNHSYRPSLFVLSSTLWRVIVSKWTNNKIWNSLIDLSFCVLWLNQDFVNVSDGVSFENMSHLARQ